MAAAICARRRRWGNKLAFAGDNTSVPNTREKGQYGEQFALRYLINHGYRVLETNFRCRQGEIDIVACEGETLSFVEVRSRTASDFGKPVETIGATKQRRIIAAARSYVSLRPWSGDCRFDVVVISYDSADKLELIRGAFDAPWSW